MDQRARSGEQAWYCVRARPKREHLAAAHLRALEGVDAFCPRLRFQRATRRGAVWFVEALFPGYLFARFDFVEFYRRVRSSQDVIGLVSFGGHVCEVPEIVVSRLQELMQGGEIRTIQTPVAVGDQVQVVTGPFQGENAVVHRLLPARQRVTLLLRCLGGELPIELPLEAIVKPADPGTVFVGT